MVSQLDAAKRAFVKLLLQLATTYGVVLALTRDSPAAAVTAAFRKVLLKVHPDKGGSVEHQKALNSARESWEQAIAEAPGKGKKRKAADAGQPPSSSDQVVAIPQREAKYLSALYRIQSVAVLLTYQKFDEFAKWFRFVQFFKDNIAEWGVRLWCATMETNEDGTYHFHACVQFHRAMERVADTFTFEGMRPNASTNDGLGEGWSGRKMQDSIHRCMFYVWANKIGTARTEEGTLCAEGNCHPAWVEGGINKYVVSGRWLDRLLRFYKLSLDVYEEYIYLAMDGVAFRKRNLDIVRAQREEAKERVEIAARVVEIRQDPDVYTPFQNVPEVQPFLDSFKKTALRYAVLLIHAISRTGKTEWATSLFTNPLQLQVGSQTYFPEGMREFKRGKFDAVILDDVRDLEFLREHQEKLQGKYNVQVPFAPTPGGTCAFKRDLYRVPFVLTINNSTRNLDFLRTDDFCSKRENVFFLSFASRPGQEPPQTTWPLEPCSA